MTIIKILMIVTLQLWFRRRRCLSATESSFLDRSVLRRYVNYNETTTLRGESPTGGDRGRRCAAANKPRPRSCDGGSSSRAPAGRTTEAPRREGPRTRRTPRLRPRSRSEPLLPRWLTWLERSERTLGPRKRPSWMRWSRGASWGFYFKGNHAVLMARHIFTPDVVKKYSQFALLVKLWALF